MRPEPFPQIRGESYFGVNSDSPLCGTAALSPGGGNERAGLSKAQITRLVKRLSNIGIF
jgi:hypothetical protein